VEITRWDFHEVDEPPSQFGATELVGKSFEADHSAESGVPPEARCQLLFSSTDLFDIG
jgi:hypothetical protein